MEKKNSFPLKLLWYIGMSLLAVIMIYPLFFAILGGFNQLSEFTEMGALLPISKDPTMEHWVYAFTPNALVPLLNSVLRATWYTVLITAEAILMGYVMVRYEFKGKKFVLSFILVTQVIPGVLTMIPTFVMVSRLPLIGGNDILGRGGHGLYNNKLILYLQLGWGSLMCVILFMMSMKSQPIAFEEAAELDGCGFWKKIWHVVIPMQKPIITCVMVNNALGNWNDWMTPFMYISDQSKTTLVTYLATLTSALKQFGSGKPYPKIFALAVVAMIPPFLIFLFFQKNIVQGIASAGVKE